jgi:Na+-driven multidrug efflux pump
VWILSIPLVAAYFIAGKYLVYLFLDSPTGEAMETGVQFLRIVAPFYFIISAKLVSDGILRGAGLMKKFMIATFTDLILRVAIAVLLSKLVGVIGIWLAWPVGWTISMVMSVLFYKSGPWNKVEVQKEGNKCEI